jgi:ABC-2 type transport system permease protein
MWQRIRALIVKELLAVWRDPKSRGILFGPPIIQMVIFTLATTQEVKNVHIAVLNRDWGTSARDLIARFEGSPNFSRVTFLQDEEEIKQAVDSRSVLMVLHIQPDFSRKVAAGEPTAVQLILDGRRSNAAQIVAGYAAQIVSRFGDELPRRGRVPQPASVVSARVWFNPNMESTWNAVPGLVAILTTVMGLMVTALSVAREREVGTFEQLLVTPLSPAEIIIGKTVPALLIGLLGTTVTLLVGTLVFRVPITGSLLLLYASTVVYLFSVIGTGLFISSLATTQQQAILGGFVFMVPASLLSGFASPIENMPNWLQQITLANPLRYFLVIVKGVFLKDMPAAIVAENLWPMAVIGLITLSSAAWLFRHRVE